MAVKRRELFLDTETRSGADLKTAGAYRYMENREYQLLLLTYAFDDEPFRTIDVYNGEPIPQEFIDGLRDSTVTKWAWNSAFDRQAISAHLGEYVAPDHWFDDMVLAAVCGLPMSLEKAGTALGLEEDKAKDRDGKALIRWFCNPCKPTKTKPDLRWHDPNDYPEKWERFKAYCSQDGVSERHIHRMLEQWAPEAVERTAWVVDQRINDRGVRIDTTLARNAMEMDALYKAELTEEAIAITGMENPNSVAQVKEWLMEQEGIEVASLNKKVVTDVVAQLSTDKAKRFMELRTELSKSSTKKYAAMVNSVCDDEHCKGMTQFYGAGRTGRWAGRRVQLQNFSKNKSPDIDQMRRLVRAGDYEGVSSIYGKVSSVLSELVRTALIPEEGHRFIVCDYSAIEARVLSWIAGEEWALEEFRGDGMIYEATGARMFGVPKKSIGKGGENHHLRQPAKTAELACIAEGQLVVTDCGLVPIECVTKNMRVWDGVQWVRHQGLLYKGVRPTVFIDGIELTADHKILTEKGMVACGESEGLNWADIRIPHCGRPRAWPHSGKWETGTHCPVPVYLRGRERNIGGASAKEKVPNEVMWVHGGGIGRSRTYNTRHDRQTPLQRVERDEAEMHEPSRPELAPVRRARNSGLRKMGKQLRGLLSRHGRRLPAGVATGSSRQLWAVLAGKLPMGDPKQKRSEQEKQPEGLCARGRCNRRRACREGWCPVRHNVEPSTSRREIAVRRGRAEVPVYDLLNAGLRHRFCLYDPVTGSIRCVSNCGYGGGMGAMKAFGADKMGMSDEAIINAVDLWREAHPNVCKLWKALERAAIRCVVHGTPQVSTTGNIRFTFEKGVLWMHLPSGRRISYFGARYGDGAGKFTKGKKVLSYMGLDQKTHKWTRIETFSGKLTENLVQATARDCLRDAMLALDKAGFRIVAHIHDEVIISEPRDGRTLEDVAEIMGRELPWATGLPLRGDGYYCDYYIKD